MDEFEKFLYSKEGIRAWGPTDSLRAAFEAGRKLGHNEAADMIHEALGNSAVEEYEDLHFPVLVGG